jgi:hypothetical protein
MPAAADEFVLRARAQIARSRLLLAECQKHDDAMPDSRLREASDKVIEASRVAIKKSICASGLPH